MSGNVIICRLVVLYMGVLERTVRFPHSSCGQQTKSIEQFMNGELADMHLVYGIADGNGQAAACIHRKCFPDRHQPHHSLFASLHQNLCEYRSLRSGTTSEGRPRSTHSVVREESVLDAMETNLRTSIHAIASEITMSCSSVQHILNADSFHAFHLQRVHLLFPNDHPKCVHFAQWFLQEYARDVNFPTYVLFTDEATFTRDRVFNHHNRHLWAEENPHGMWHHVAQHCFKVNVWAGLVSGCLVGPYLLPSRLTATNYLIFLEQVLPGLLDNVPPNVRRNMWF